MPTSPPLTAEGDRWEPHDMGVVIQVELLRRELARRGWTYRDLARASRLSAPTITAVMAGRPVAPQTVRLIAKALTEAPPIEGVDLLL